MGKVQIGMKPARCRTSLSTGYWVPGVPLEGYWCTRFDGRLCLQLYSQHYPNVIQGGEPLGVEEAVRRTTAIVTEQLIEQRFQTLTAQTDTLSALCLLFLANRDTITYNTLNKWLRGRGADVEDFIARELLRHEKDALQLIKPQARMSYIEPASRPLAVDGAHYLYAVMKRGDLEAEARRWVSQERSRPPKNCTK